MIRPAFHIILTALLTFSFLPAADAQTTGFQYYYRVYFRDKGNITPGDFKASDLLSERAIARRMKSGITVPDYHDLPVNSDYINQISDLGLVYHISSRWQNTALFKSPSPVNTEIINVLPFVSEVRLVKNNIVKKSTSDKLDIQFTKDDYLSFDRPLTMLNGHLLHSAGFNGEGVVIAVLDGGFFKADIIPSLASLRTRNGILGTRDFVTNREQVYSYHNHGTAVLSVLAGQITGELSGTAPGADYWLLRTEDTSSEFPCEEDFWAAGAEFADSAGADIITSSLGYYIFDDSEMDYKFSEMDGNTAFVTRAADIAASKGILVVASAGNERNKSWKRIIAPSDGDSILAVAAVDGNRLISSFSSAGPSADERIKPDNAAQGVAVPVQTEESSVQRANGTSFSCPVLSGLCACILEAFPGATNMEIVRLVQNSGHIFLSPDSLYGFGIPDMAKVFTDLQDIHIEESDAQIKIGPNPFTETIEILFQEIPGSLHIEMFSAGGAKTTERDYGEYISRSLTISDLANSPQGLYILRIKTSNGIYIRKLIKIKN